MDRKIKEYTWINLSAKEALSYKTEISTETEGERQSKGQLKHTKEQLIASKKKCNVHFLSIV